MKTDLQNSKQGFIKTILVIVIAIVILSALGVTWQDIVNNRYVDYLVNLILNFFN